MYNVDMAYVSGEELLKNWLEPLNYYRCTMNLSESYFIINVKPFLMARTPVTNHLWYEVMSGKSVTLHSESFHPKTNINLIEIGTFISRLNQMTDKSYRLPSVSEWELAVGNIQNYSGDHVWHYDNSIDRRPVIKHNVAAHPVGEKEPNEFGIYDMIGNVFEMCYNSDNDYAADKTLHLDGSDYDDVLKPSHFPGGIRGGYYCMNLRECLKASRGQSVFCDGMRRDANMGLYDKSPYVGFRLAMSIE